MSECVQVSDCLEGRPGASLQVRSEIEIRTNNNHWPVISPLALHNPSTRVPVTCATLMLGSTGTLHGISDPRRGGVFSPCIAPPLSTRSRPSPGQLAVSARSSPCFPMDALAVSTQWLASADLGKNKLGFSFLSKVLFAHSGPQVALTPLHPAVPSGKGFVAGGWSRHPWAPGIKPGMSN